MIFNDVQVEDCRWARPLLEMGGYRSCEFSFVNIFIWGKVYNTQIANFEDTVIARSNLKDVHYLFPAGKANLSATIPAILNDAEALGKILTIYSVPEERKNEMEALFPGIFHFEMPREESDYIYLSSDLADLPGKKYQKKRNHCSRFERDYPDWKFHEITPDTMPEIKAFNNNWCNLYDNRGDEGIAEEHLAIERAFRNYEELRLKGGYITVNDEVVAFSFGSPLGDDMFVTHVEKALYTVNSAYGIINREMARNFCRNYMYINRENDVGEEGLRTAKLSYHPVALEHKYTAELKANR